MKNFQSVFSCVKSRNKIYCIESSAATYAILPHFKRHVINTVKDQVLNKYNAKFNLVCFNSDVAKWCVSLAPCTNEYIAVAEDWLQHIQPTGTCNFIGALVSALQETVACSLCFLVTVEPDQTIDDILDLFTCIGHKSRIHIRLYLFGGENAEEVQNSYDIYNAIASETYGTFAFVKLNKNNELNIYESERNFIESFVDVTIDEIDIQGEINPKSQLNRDQLNALTKIMPGVYKDKQTNEVYPFCIYPHQKLSSYEPFDFWKRVEPSSSYVDCMKMIQQTNQANFSTNHVSALATSIIVGRRVLARNYTDGQYYLATVKDQVKANEFTVVFGPYDVPSLEYVATDYQTTRLLDLIDLDDAMKKSILPGDRVLAPDPNYSRSGMRNCRFITGTVLDGRVYRDRRIVSKLYRRLNLEKAVEVGSGATVESESSTSLVIEFTHPLNKTERCAVDKVMYIPEPFYQRISLEGAMPRHARESLYKVVNYPESSLPGYPTTGGKKVPSDYTFTQPAVVKGRALQVDYLMPPYSLPIYPIVDVIMKDEQYKRMVSTSDWVAGKVNLMGPAMFNKDDMKVPDSNYTVKELRLKVKDQLDAFKTMRSNSIGLHPGRKNLNRIATSDINQSPKKSFIHNPPNNCSHQSYMDSSTHLNENKSLKNRKQSTTIHEEYQQEIDIIRKQSRKTLSNETRSDSGEIAKKSENSSLSKLKIRNPSTPSDYSRLKNNVNNNSSGFKEEANLRFSRAMEKSQSAAPSNVAVVTVTDLGQEDKVKEALDQQKLQRRQQQVSRRMQLERERFCDAERMMEAETEYRRCQTGVRFSKEVDRRRLEEEAVDNAQALKRSLVTEVEGTVAMAGGTETTLQLSTKPQTYEEVDRLRIEQLRQARIRRDDDRRERDQAALRYVERLEETKKERSDARWWHAQSQMFLENPQT